MADDGAALVVRLAGQSREYDQMMKNAVNTAETSASKIKNTFEKLDIKIPTGGFGGGGTGEVGAKTMAFFGLKTREAADETKNLNSVAREGKVSLLGLAGAVTAGGLAAEALTEIIKNTGEAIKSTVEFANQINDTAVRIGTTTDRLQEFQFVALKSSISTGQMETALVGFNKALGNAESNTRQGLQGFRAIFGSTFTAESAKQLAANGDALEKTIKALAGLNIEARTSAAQKLGLIDILPTINLVADGLRNGKDILSEWVSEAHRVGFVLDSDILAKAGEIETEWNILNRVIKVETASAILSLAPALDWLLHKVAEIAAAIGDAFSAFQNIQDLTHNQLQRNLVKLTEKRDQVAGGAQGFNPELDIKTGNLTFSRKGVVDALNKKIAETTKAKIESEQRQAVISSAQTARASGAMPFNANPTKARGGKAPRDRTEEQLDRFLQESAAIEKEKLGVRNNEFATLEQRGDLEIQILEAEHKEKIYQLQREAARNGISKASAEQLIAQTDALYEEKKAVQLKINSNKLLEESIQIQKDSVASQLSAINIAGSPENSNRTNQEIDQVRKELLDQERQNLIDAKAFELSNNTGLTELQKTRQLQNFTAKLDLDLEQKAFEAQKEIFSLQTEMLGLQSSMAKTRGERERLELEILAIEKKEKDEALKALFASNPNIDTNQQQQIKNAVDQVNKLKQKQIIEQNAGPIFQDLQQNLQDLGDMMENSLVRSIHTLEDSLVDAAFESKNLGDAVKSIFRDIGKDILRSVIRENITLPLERALTKGTQGKIDALGVATGGLVSTSAPTGALGSPLHVVVDNNFGALGGVTSGGLEGIISGLADNIIPADIVSNVPDLTPTADLVAKLNADFSGTLIRDGGNFITQTASVFKSNTTGGFLSGLEGVFGGALRGFNGIFSSLGSLFGGGSGGGGGILGSLLGGLGSLFGGSGGGGGSLGSLFAGGGGGLAGLMFAKGTDFAPGGMAIVGEKGPELVNLPRGSKVTPNNKLHAYAGGTNFATGGMSLVGERGPELLNLPGGSQIMPSNMLGSIIGSGGNKSVVYDLRGAVVTEDLLKQMNEISLKNSIVSVQFSRNLTKNDLNRSARRSLA